MNYFGKENFEGGCYELALELGPPSDSRLQCAFEAIWTYPGIEGCYLDRAIEPADQKRISPNEVPSSLQWHALGLVTLPHGVTIPCSTYCGRESEMGVELGPDWLVFYLPWGALFRANDNSGMEDYSTEYMGPISAWLADLGQYIYDKVPFELGLVATEVSGYTYAADVVKNGVPNERGSIGYLWPENGKLAWYPPIWEP